MTRFECTGMTCDFVKEHDADDEPLECPKCGSRSYRIVNCSNIKRTHNQSHPRWSISMGVPANQVNDFRKRFPNSIYNDRGDLLIKNRSDKLRQIKERGMAELS